MAIQPSPFAPIGGPADTPTEIVAAGSPSGAAGRSATANAHGSYIMGTQARLVAEVAGLQTKITTQGVPTGGTTGQLLRKTSATNYDTAWATVAIPAVPALVSTLPASPTDGTEVYYQSAAMATAGVVWHLRYRSAASGSYRWEFVGGPPLFAQTTLDHNVPGSQSTWTNLASGPTLNAPLAGDYTIRSGAMTYVPAGAGAGVGIALGSANVVATDELWLTAGVNGSVFREIQRTLASAAQLRWQTSNGGPAMTLSFPSLSLAPVRVG